MRWHLGSFLRHYRLLRRVGLDMLMDELRLLTGSATRVKISTRICAAIAGITAIDGTKYSERVIT